MALNAIPEIFENAFEGVNTAVTPEMISPNQIQWGKNLVNRGAKPGTRPSWVYRMTLPSGLVQGASYFGVQGGMGVASIAGNIWRLRIGPVNYTAEQINLPWRNSAIVKKVYMQQTVESLVIQDGQSNPIIYNGSTAVRSDPTDGGVPRGTVMAYGNGRLWVAINSKELVAGDIRTNQAGSELKFTETNYLSGGGTLYFPRGITALGFIATTGTSDYGALLVFGLDYTESVRADITFRDLWAQTPGFVTNVLRHTGCASHWSLAEVNQDLYWRDAGGGLRSIRSALADESGPGNAPISREISRLTDYDSPQLLGFSSSISFNNRLITTCSPFLNENHGVSWKDLAPLDFAPMSTMRGKSLPAYDGEWDGLNFTHLFQGQFNGRSRAFGVASNPDGTNALWELMEDGRGGLDDVSVTCSDGSSTAIVSPVTCTLESGARSAGDSKVRKRAERCDVFISDMLGDVNLKVYWRVDNNQKWLLWNEGVDVCAKNGEPETPGATTHVWKNILAQQRPQIKTFTVPTHIDPITAFALQTGFEFQVRLVWTGRLKIDKFILWLRPLAESPYAIRDVVVANCLTNDVTDNEVVYSIPFDPCPAPTPPPPVGCVYALPSDMAASSTFFQSFAGGDFVDALWTTPFSTNLYSGPGPGYDNHAGNIYLSENGKKVVLLGTGPVSVNVVTRNNDNSFSVEQVNSGVNMDTGFTMSRDGILAGSVSGRGAVWLGGVTAAPTVDTAIANWSYISSDGTKLYGTTVSGDAIERTIGGADVIIEAGLGATFAALSYCNDCVILNSDEIRVYKKINDVWTFVATLADQFGDTGDYPAVVQMTGDGARAFGNSGSQLRKCFWWDLSGTGVLTANVIPTPADCTSGSFVISGVSSDGRIIVGYYLSNVLFATVACYYLASENFSTVHKLVDYFNSVGLTSLYPGAAPDGSYTFYDNVTVSADGTQFVARGDLAPINRSMMYVACPLPT